MSEQLLVYQKATPNTSVLATGSVALDNIRALLATLGFGDYRGENWDYSPFEFAITEMRFEFGIT